MGDRVRLGGCGAVILGTAGHIDHGKTAIVRALTGVDTDRLTEEKRRGITIELGFAPLVLDDGAVVSIVDVPGHARLVGTMTAGAWPLHAALLVVAATDGVMPQTREHCAILRAFRVPVIAIALTHVDRIASAELADVESRVRASLAACDVDASTPVIHTVAPRGDGIDLLRRAIATAAAMVAERDPGDLARFVADRAFTLHGLGTIVTGTLVSGSLQAGERVRLLPGTRQVRIRSIHTHGAPVERARAGARVALALADVAPADVPRGGTLVSDAAWRATRRMTVRLHSPTATVPRSVVLHVAGTSSSARLTMLGQAQALARLSLEHAIVARAGDAVVVRAAAPMSAVLAGEVVDPAPDRPPAVFSPDASTPERLDLIAAAAGTRGVARSALPVRLGTSPRATDDAVRRAAVVEVDGRIFARGVVAAMEEQLVAEVGAWSAEHPFATGVSIRELGTVLHADPVLVGELVSGATGSDRLVSRGGKVSLAAPRLSSDSAALLAQVLHAVSAAGLEPPTVTELGESFGPGVEAAVRHAERAGNLVRVGGVRCYAAPVLAQAIERLRTAMRGGGEHSPSALRQILGVSRKYLIPLLEYCDSIRVTERHSGGRVLVDVSSR